jgi:uncharacterized protein YjbI with pentapeptide repeats
VRDQGTCQANLVPGGDLRQCDLSGADLASADLNGANLGNTDLSGATLDSVGWDSTTCPDETNSNDVGGTCCNNMAGSILAVC